MLSSVERDVYACHATDLSSPHPTTIDDEFRPDIAIFGGHARDLSGALMNGGYLGVLVYPGATHTRAFGIGQRRVDRIGLAFTGDEYAADEIVRVQQRPEFTRFFGRHDLDVESETLAHRGTSLEFDEALVIRRDHQSAVLLVAGGLAGLFFERQQNLGGVLREPGHIECGAELADQARRMPRRAAGQGLSFEQDNVSPACLREVIGDTTADDAAADDDDLSLFGQFLRHVRLARNGPPWIIQKTAREQMGLSESPPTGGVSSRMATKRQGRMVC